MQLRSPASTGSPAHASPFSGLAQRSLTLRPACSPRHFVSLYTRSFSHFVVSIIALSASGWRKSYAVTEDRPGGDGQHGVGHLLAGAGRLVMGSRNSPPGRTTNPMATSPAYSKPSSNRNTIAAPATKPHSGSRSDKPPGRGKKCPTHRQIIPIKDIWLYHYATTSPPPSCAADPGYGITKYLRGQHKHGTPVRKEICECDAWPFKNLGILYFWMACKPLIL